jgi:hypothetical protein
MESRHVHGVPDIQAGASAWGSIICDHEALPYRRLISGADRMWIMRNAVNLLSKTRIDVLDSVATLLDRLSRSAEWDIQMSGERTVNGEQDTAPQTKPKQTRQRSTVPFAYIDLQGVMEVAVAIHEHVGNGDCDEHQLSAWLRKSQKSSGFRSVWSTARLFGLIETENSRFRLSLLGRRAVDPAQERNAKAKAFLTVPLYDAVFEKYKGGVLPPAAALEREIVEIGVAEKQKRTARQVLERSAQYAGFFEHGKDRLVMPGISPDERREPPKTDESERRGSGDKGGGGDGETPRHPLIEGMFQSLPPNGQSWTLEEAADWLHAAAYNLRFAYKLKGKITVDIKIEPPAGAVHIGATTHDASVRESTKLGGEC